MIGWALRQLILWGGLALLFFVVGTRLLPRPADTPPAPTAASSEPVQTRGAMPNSLVFRANAQGHVVVEAAVNGVPVRFLVDTGATMVVLTLKDAAAAGLSGSDLVFSMRTSTANGVARAAPVRLRELRIDQLMVRDVAAAVVENLNISLLGQSFLTRLDGYEMRDGVLTLSYW
jgi:aspartyl protease family protein